MSTVAKTRNRPLKSTKSLPGNKNVEIFENEHNKKNIVNNSNNVPFTYSLNGGCENYPSNSQAILLTSSSLKQLLTSSLQPVETIAHIQRESSWGRVGERLQALQSQQQSSSFSKRSLYNTLKKLAQFERLLPILDVHKHSRVSLFKRVYDELNLMLLEKLKTNLNSQKYNFIIKDCLREYENPLVSKILIYLLENNDNINYKHLEIIANNQSLYSMCSLKIKQRIWLVCRQLFFKEVTYIMNEAISKDQDFYRQLTIQNPFSKQCTLLFNLDNMCKTLSSYVAGYPDLYDNTIEMIIDSYEQSGQDSIYCLFLFSFNYSLIKDYPDENICNNISYDILRLLNSSSNRDSSGCLSEEYLKDIVELIDSLNLEDPKKLKLAFMTFSSPIFMHMLSSTISKIFSVLFEESKLPKVSKELQMLIYILNFCCQDLNLDDVIWSLKLPSIQPQQFYTKLISVLMNQQFSIEKNLTSLIKISNEVKNLSKSTSAASFLVMHTFSSCLKKISSHRSKSLIGSVNNLVTFVKEFERAILNIGPQHCLELMSTVFHLMKLKSEISPSTSIVFIQSLFFPWLKSANYPANFIMIKLMNCFKDILDEKQWKFVKEIASELDHEEFCKLHGNIA